MKKHLIKKCLRATRLNKLLYPLADAMTDDTPLDMDKATCIQVLSSVYPNKDKSALWAMPLPEREQSAFQLDVIVPVYNAKATLEECLRSILTQKTNYSFRLIVIDDGSTDGTSALVDNYSTQKNVLVLHQKNRGASAARNTGILCSDAQYLMFMDADDRLAPMAIEHLMENALKNNADIVEGSYFNFAHNYRRNHRHKVGKMQSMELYGGALGKVLRRSLFKRIGFPEGSWFEDSVMHQIIYSSATNCWGISDFIFERRLTAGSITHVNRGNTRSIDTVWVTLMMMQDRKELGLKNSQAHYEYMLNMAALSQYRLEGLDEKIRKAAFGVFAALLEENYAGFSTQRKEKRRLEESLKKWQYAKFKRYCEWN